jgi:hypothetical protein
MRAIPKLPQARLCLKAAQWGTDEMVKQQAYGSGYRFFLVGILASLRAVQHALYNHDRELSPEHRAAIDQWWKRTTPSDKPELAFIVDARNQILKGGAFQSYAISSESGIGEGDTYTVMATEYECPTSSMASIATCLLTSGRQSTGVTRSWPASKLDFHSSTRRMMNSACYNWRMRKSS